MNNLPPRSITQALAVVLLLAAAPALAQKTEAKKIYCWQTETGKVCGDALPASAVDNARTEFSVSGMATKQVQRAPTEAELKVARAQALLGKEAARVNASQARQESAMVASFATEVELEQNFKNRIEVIESNIETSRIGIKSTRRSLLNLLQRAGQAELAEKPVAKTLAGNILSQHQALRGHQQLLEARQLELGTIDEELNAALARYRELKPAGAAGSEGQLEVLVHRQ
ncbi:hypothetical protein ACW7G0_13350 [Lysobacter sp. A286]